MKIFRYRTTGSWYKGNTHIHSLVSDGGLNFHDLAELYAGAGYHFLFRTDHWTVSDCAADPATYPLLWMDGVELDGKDERSVYFHVVCLGKIAGITADLSLDQALQAVRAQGGLAILAHPHWTGNRAQDALNLVLDGAEVYNNVCQSMNGKGYAGPVWDELLDTNPNLLAFASDDTHYHPTEPWWNGGWIVVNAPDFSSQALWDAIRSGNFYASTGPEFHQIEYSAGKVRVRTSPVKFIRLIGPTFRGKQVYDQSGHGLEEAEFTIPEDWKTVYIQLEDSTHGLAWTNPLFVEEAERDSNTKA